MEFSLGEAEPDIGLELAGLFELMLEEIENDDASAGFQQGKGSAQGLSGALGVVQRLAEEDEIDTAGLDRRVLDVAETELKIREAMLLREIGPVGDHGLAVIHGDDLLRALGQ